ncbi:hemolysin-III related-domain-containing protein [Phlyctochytrium arcticum]|nr:hemolysin-III related-domain-containing protein [Phlyctochytrium arcticum]
MSNRHSAHITAVLPDPGTREEEEPTVVASSYEQRMGAARRRHSSKGDRPEDILESFADPTATDPQQVPTTPSGKLRRLSDYEKFKPKAGEPNKYTVPIKDMPDWYVDNVYLLKGYRRITNSYLGCVKSLSYIHNETGNVVTHLIGAIIFVILAQVFYSWMTVETNTWADITIMGMYFLGAVTCLGLSTTFHLCCCHSRKVAAVWLRGDYVGIVTLIMGSFVPSIYYGFFCSPKWQVVYLTIIVVFGITTICITVSPKFFAPQYRMLRTTLFVSMGFTGIIPLLHALVKYGTHMTRHALSSGWLISSGITYFLGTLIYAARIPERWWPGKFDLFFHSHQIFHCFVLAGAIIHYYGVVQAYKWWHTHNYQCNADIMGMLGSMRMTF